jgi:hypothetical protein
MEEWGGQSERIYLARVEPFEPESQVDLAGEHVGEIRWWTLDELVDPNVSFAPRGLPELVLDLLEHGPPAKPIDVGV